MKQSDRDRMIERYLSRRMSHAEEIEFHRRLDADPELRALLETEQAIQNTLYKDRDALPVASVESRLNILAMLGALSSAEGAASGVGASAAGGGHGLALITGGVVKGIIIAAVGIGAVAGGIFLSQREPATEKPRPDVRVIAPAPTRPTPPQMREVPEEEITAPPSPSRDADARSDERSSESAHAEKPAIVQEPPAAPPDARRRSASAAASIPAPNSSAPHADSVSTAHRHEPLPPDTMRVKVTIDLNKLGHP